MVGEGQTASRKAQERGQDRREGQERVRQDWDRDEWDVRARPTARCIGSSGIATPTDGSSRRSLINHRGHQGHKGTVSQRVLPLVSLVSFVVNRALVVRRAPRRFCLQLSAGRVASRNARRSRRRARLSRARAARSRRRVRRAAVSKAAIAAGLRPIIGAELTIAASLKSQVVKSQKLTNLRT